MGGNSSGEAKGITKDIRYPSASFNQSLDDTSLRDLNAKRIIDRKFLRIFDDFTTLDQVTAALRRAGLESSNLILGIDFTKSNEWTGRRSFHGKSLHHVGETLNLNPYERAISIIGRTLSSFDDDNLIPCYGFGDVTTTDKHVFSFKENDEFCNGFEEALELYRELMPRVRLSGPTSFAPVIEMAMSIVENSGGKYHVLVIIADGQVTRSVDIPSGLLSHQEKQTVQAIVEASKFPLSIVLVGVGDGPWDTMKQFDDNIPARQFDNFQFVNFTEIMSKDSDTSKKEADFALAALMELPLQYEATVELHLLGHVSGASPRRLPLPPPASSPVKKGAFSSLPETSTRTREPTSRIDDASAPQIPNNENMICPICLTNPKNMAFECGHQTCRDCGKVLNVCPICRRPISNRIRLF